MYNRDELFKLWDRASTKRGWLYAMENPQNPGIIKVGLTRKDPFKRAKSATTAGVLGKYNVLLAFMYTDCFQAESRAHQLLQPFNVEKELFKIELASVKNILVSLQKEDVSKFETLNVSYLLYDVTSDRWLSQANY